MNAQNADSKVSTKDEPAVSASDPLFKEDQKLLFDTFKHVTTLSTGSVVLLVTFLEKLFQNPEWKILVAVSFVSFSVSIVTSVFLMVVIGGGAHLSRNPTEAEASVGLYSFTLSLGGFVWGIVSLIIFALRNFYSG